MITYARRYALYAMTGVAPDDEDDDAEEAQKEHGRADGQPVNSQGALDRKRTTDAEKDAAGNMTDEQWAEHKRLRRGADGTLPPADKAKMQYERPTAPDPDDPFAGIPAAGDPVKKEELPGTSSRAQLDHIFGQFDKLGYAKDDRQGRLDLTMQIIGREIKSSANLSMVEATQVAKALDERLREVAAVGGE